MVDEPVTEADVTRCTTARMVKASAKDDHVTATFAAGSPALPPPRIHQRVLFLTLFSTLLLNIPAAPICVTVNMDT
jgi:hypothetical protein